MQGSYIGNTTASQAVKAGSTPVPCSKMRSRRKVLRDLIFLKNVVQSHLKMSVRVDVVFLGDYLWIAEVVLPCHLAAVVG